MIEHSKYFPVTLKIVRTLESVFLSFSAKAFLSEEYELLNMIVYVHPSPYIFRHLLY